MNAIKIDHKGRNQIIEGVWTIDLIPKGKTSNYYYPPNNSAEILVVLEGNIKRSSVGSTNSYELQRHNVYLSNIRSRGSVFTTNEKASILLIKLNPTTQKIFMEEGLLHSRDKIRALNLPIQSSFIWKKHIINRDIPKILVCLDQLISANKPIKKFNKSRVVSDSIKMIKKNNGKVLVKDIYQKMGVCKSTLEHKFNNEIGISPKEFCKIEKLNHFLSNYKIHENEMTLTELTYKSGYYDQSHLIKDFRFYIEQNPKKFLTDKKKILL